MNSGADTEQAKFWHADDIGRLELLKATYISHSFPRHTHEGYVIGVIERGVEAFHYQGSLHHAPAGSVVVINPDTIHTGHAIDPAGWTYRTLYPASELIRQVACQVEEKREGLPYFPEPVIFDPHLTQLIRQLHQTLETADCPMQRESIFISAMAQLIGRHAKRPPTPRKIRGDQRAVRRIKDFINDGYALNISLSQLSSQIGLSPY
jgi:hypothetical protein